MMFFGHRWPEAADGIQLERHQGGMGGEFVSRRHGSRGGSGPKRLWMQRLQPNSRAAALSSAARSSAGGFGAQGNRNPVDRVTGSAGVQNNSRDVTARVRAPEW